MMLLSKSPLPPRGQPPPAPLGEGQTRSSLVFERQRIDINSRKENSNCLMDT